MHTAYGATCGIPASTMASYTAAADLGALLSRDLSEPLGDIEHALRHYEAASGEAVDRDLVRYHAIRFGLITPLATAAVVASPPVVADYVQ